MKYAVIMRKSVCWLLYSSSSKLLVVSRFLLWTLVRGTASLPLPVLASVTITITVLALVLLRSSVFALLGRFMMPVTDNVLENTKNKHNDKT